MSYFGEPFAEACGNCDNCDAGRGKAENGRQPFPVGTRVTRVEWGEGVVQRYERDRIALPFGSVGYKTLSLELVAERGLVAG